MLPTAMPGAALISSRERAESTRMGQEGFDGGALVQPGRQTRLWGEPRRDSGAASTTIYRCRFPLRSHAAPPARRRICPEALSSLSAHSP